MHMYTCIYVCICDAAAPTCVLAALDVAVLAEGGKDLESLPHEQRVVGHIHREVGKAEQAITHTLGIAAGLWVQS